ncbi:17316_t:CDS:2 [Funneliformis caledonium]|uniref:17316_t:CDS:1 n=1 Tax=Funneliformis caledonium TaxID=1117310 RepID=A0A9N9CB82_9GLOM|nr:17316_t:CDS:2 [Funneliformis caledonium]
MVAVITKQFVNIAIKVNKDVKRLVNQEILDNESLQQSVKKVKTIQGQKRINNYYSLADIEPSHQKEIE